MKSTRFNEVRATPDKTVNLSLDIAVMLCVMTGLMIYFWAAGDLDLWRFGIAS